ncbi:hypothetical protein JOF56_003006 [Kibdelosporangium banguiense]|uniref:Helicase ATP-binding domain-containing protein n=1 Tax=Kibdelosporangium banguiense TaxID=1365924 RepID=A0ABS4TDX9_9PSEU|nr:DEAD/DEAH box helicase [Kibdelosporangium banguiense]MBP2322621.1 hypothetical protein [Kibdelosporangium banguiense]
MAFKGGSTVGPPPESPESLYRDLPRRPDAVPGLWIHQGDILREYRLKHTESTDVALELPTGTGKTIPGLVIADWVRRVRRQRTAYACPTQQLARQVASIAAREGVPVSLLVGSHQRWPADAENRYVAAEAVAVTTYSSVFNSSPKLAPADLLLFDDAHAGEQYVGEQYGVHVKRRDLPAIYEALLTAVGPALDGMLLQRLRDASPDPNAYNQLRLVVPLRHMGMTAVVDKVLAGLDGPLWHRYSMIRGGLASCLVYVSYSGILIRPVVPPTWDNLLFAGARQRLYLSATLGNGGELERSFGRTGIKRLALPATAPTPRSGRRYFVFPELVEGTDPAELARTIVALAGKALVLAPDTETAVSRAQGLAQPGWPVLTKEHVENGLEAFGALPNGTCGLAARYDGLDLPGDACHAVVLDGKPDQDTLQERFLTERVRAGTALAERIRTRVVQGAGRCTRGPNDWAIVVVLGADLTKYLLSPETWRALDPELQAEIQFGIRNSRNTSSTDVLDNVKVFLDQADAWREGAEPHLLEYRQGAVRVLPDGTDSLAKAVDSEIEASTFAVAGRWAEASRHAQDVAQKLAVGGTATHGYRAFWLYLAGVWADQAGADSGDMGLRRTARELVRKAEDTSKPGTWTRELPPLPDAQAEPLGPQDTAAVVALAQRVISGIDRDQHDVTVTAMLADLGQTDATIYEPALTQLGLLLGADASKPAGRGRCDSTWCWENTLWIAVEAKSEQLPGGMIHHKYVRQAGDQLRLLAADRHQDAAPAGSVTVIVSPKPAVDPDGAKGAEDHVYLVHPDVIIELARDVQAAWAIVLAEQSGKQPAELKRLIAVTLEQRGILPMQVRERLTPQPIAAR